MLAALSYLHSRFQTILIKLRWRLHNKDNNTYLQVPVDFNKISVGKYTYGPLYVLDNGEGAKLSIGSFCSIADHVTFILNSDHPLHYFSTFPMKRGVLKRDVLEAVSKGDIIVDDDVWIAQNVTILSGVHIGKGAVIAAGAVVSKDIPSYAVAMGIPAKVTKYRFESPIREKLIDFDYNKLDKGFISDNIDEFYKEIKSSDDVELLIKEINEYDNKENGKA